MPGFTCNTEEPMDNTTNTLYATMLQSAIRTMLMWAIGAFGWQFLTPHVGGIVTSVSTLALIGLSMFWSYKNQKTLLHTEPPVKDGPTPPAA